MKHNISNKLVSCTDVGVEKDPKITTQEMKNNISNKLVSDSNFGVEKDPKITTQKMKNNISNKLVSCTDVGIDKDSKRSSQKNINKYSSKLIDNISMMSTITRLCSIYIMKFQTTFAVNKDFSNPMNIFCSACYFTSIQNQSPPKQNVSGKETTPDKNTKIVKLISNEKNETRTPIAKLTNSKYSINNQSLPISKNYIEIKQNKVTKKSKDAITYSMSLFDDYITTCLCKFTFLIM